MKMYGSLAPVQKLYPTTSYIAMSGLLSIAQEGSHALVSSEAGIWLDQLHKAVGLQVIQPHTSGTW